MTCPCPKIGTESECLIDGIFCTIHTAKLEERLQTLTKKAASTSDDLFNSRQIIMKASAIVRTWDVPHQLTATQPRRC